MSLTAPAPSGRNSSPLPFLGLSGSLRSGLAVSHRMPTSVPVTHCPQSVVTVRTSCSSHSGHVVPPLLPPRVGQGHTPPLGTTAIGLPPSGNCSPAPISPSLTALPQPLLLSAHCTLPCTQGSLPRMASLAQPCPGQAAGSRLRASLPVPLQTQCHTCHKLISGISG